MTRGPSKGSPPEVTLRPGTALCQEPQQKDERGGGSCWRVAGAPKQSETRAQGHVKARGALRGRGQ